MTVFNPCIIRSLVFFKFNIESRKMRKGLLFHFFLFFPKKQEFSLIFRFSFRGRNMNKQFENSITTRGRELNAPFCWLVSRRSNRAVISSSTVSCGRIIVLRCCRWTDSLRVYCNYIWSFSHQTTREMNGSTQLIPGQSLDKAFFCVDQRFSKCQGVCEIIYLPYFPDCKDPFLSWYMLWFIPKWLK